MELDIDVLVDDSPVNIRAAREHGMLAATLIHPWNEELVAGEDPGVVGARALARAGRGGGPRPGRGGPLGGGRGRVPGTIGRMAESTRTSPGHSAGNGRAAAGRDLPAVRDDDLRRHLPGVEPDRRLTDWGRSERIEGAMDRTIVDFLYRYWFRAEVEGIENVPSTGGALLVSNHAGALPPDATMIAKAIREEHPHPRAGEHHRRALLQGLPGLLHAAAQDRRVAAHPANVHRLLYDEEQLVLVFPEGRKGTEKLYRDRYRLRRFGRGGFVEAAMRARVPIVPVSVVGAEEAAPVFAQIGLLKRLTGLLYVPLTPTFPHLGPLGMLGYLPAKFKLRFLEPVTFDEPDAARGRGAGPDRGPGRARADPGEPVRHARHPQVGLDGLTRCPRAAS